MFILNQNKGRESGATWYSLKIDCCQQQFLIVFTIRYDFGDNKDRLLNRYV